jgi:hypothetical protein
MVDTEISIELDADDGDSVQVQGRLIESVLTPGSVANIVAAKEVKIYVKTLSAGQQPTLSVRISAKSAGDDFMEIATIVPSSNVGTIVASATLPVLAKRLKIDGLTSDLEVILLGRG